MLFLSLRCCNVPGTSKSLTLFFLLRVVVDNWAFFLWIPHEFQDLGRRLVSKVSYGQASRPAFDSQGLDERTDFPRLLSGIFIYMWCTHMLVHTHTTRKFKNVIILVSDILLVFFESFMQQSFIRFTSPDLPQLFQFPRSNPSCLYIQLCNLCNLFQEKKILWLVV